MLNPFFLQGSKTEQGLLQDLINESIKIYGIDVHYLPRQYVTERTVIREVIESKFTNAFPIEAYISSVEGYGNNPTILSKFGIQALNEITLVISSDRFSNYISPLIKNQPNIKISTRPKEGDLIYFPLGKRLFEIKYVEHETPFYQLNNSYTYELRCELFRYEDEFIDTSISEIDELTSGGGGSGGGGSGGSGGSSDGESPGDGGNVIGNLLSLTMVGVATQATATATIVNGGVRSIIVTNRGGGYTSTPTVGISSAQLGGRTATAIAEMIGGIVVCNDNVNPSSKSVQSVFLTNSGFGYTVAPGVRFIGGGGQGATALATIGDGVVGIVSITNPGSGYATPPSITFSGISSISAQATATIDSTGRISSIILTNSGLGYTQAPTITVANPPLMSSGNFIFNETVIGSQSNTTGVVKFWNSQTNILQVSNVTGNFIIGENIVGTASSASHYLRLIETFPRDNGFATNDEIQEEANQIIDFSETNPFGMP